MRLRGIALWLVPQPRDRLRLAARIAELSRRLGTPRFPPHVTLIGGLSRPERAVVLVASRLARSTSPFRLRPKRVVERAEFYRCVYLALAGSSALGRLRARALAALGPPRRRFLPHLSLVYGALPVRTRRTLAAELARARQRPFRVARLQVVRTDGEPREWRLVGSFALSRRERSQPSSRSESASA